MSQHATEERAPILRKNPGEEQFRVFIETVRDYALLILDVDGNIATWNAGAAAIKGWTASEIIGQHFSRFYPPESIASGLPALELQGAIRDGRYEDEGWRVRKDGSRFWANVVITALRDSDGRHIGFAKVTRDLTERRKYEIHLRESEERFRLLVESVIDYAIVTIDAEGYINSWNHGAERITGFSATEIVGRHFSRLYPPEDIADQKPLRQVVAARSQGRVSEEGWRLRRDGTQYWANSVIGRLPRVEGGTEAFYIVTQDLTQRRHAESLADTAQKMHEFIAMLAHELRNPLSPIRNAVMLMERRGIEDPVVESMRQTIERQSAQLVRIIDELLDVNRVARGQLSVEKDTVDLRDVIHRAVETSRPLIDSRHHTLTLRLAERPICVDADSLRMTQVVVNLLNNAAKYTPEGGDIRLDALMVGDDAEIRVLDNGKGIERAALERIFDLFIQLEPNAGGTLGGLGVGLALVRRIVELHGGRVQARSEGPGRGSEFIVRIPMSRASVTPEPVVATPRHIAPLRVLVVDDNVDAADSLTMLLQQSGHEVRTAYDGPAALREVQASTPHLVLLDIGMPHMSGHDVARANTAMTLPRRPMIVAVSGWGQPADRERAREAGFHRHYGKPLSEDDLQGLLGDVAAQRDAAEIPG